MSKSNWDNQLNILQDQFNFPQDLLQEILEYIPPYYKNSEDAIEFMRILMEFTPAYLGDIELNQWLIISTSLFSTSYTSDISKIFSDLINEFM